MNRFSPIIEYALGGYEFTKNLYELRDFLKQKHNAGYKSFQFNDVQINYGTIVLTSPDDKHCSYVIEERFGWDYIKYHIHRVRRIPYWLQKKMAEQNDKEANA